MATQPTELFRIILDEIKAIAKTETIMGEPITVGDTTIIPVCKVTIGFGGGGGEGGEKEKAGGAGAGGGGGVRIDPAAFIVIRGDQVSVHGAKPGKFESLFEAIPGLIEKVQEAKEKRKEKEKA
jgi:uncharacterized spore protein YtfJ